METEKTEMYKYENQPEEPLLSHEPHLRQTYIKKFETKESFATITLTSTTTNTITIHQHNYSQKPESPEKSRNVGEKNLRHIFMHLNIS